MRSSLAAYLELLRALRNQILICLSKASANISEIIIKCVNARSLLRIECRKSFYPEDGKFNWTADLLPFADDRIRINVSRMNLSAKKKLRDLLRYNPDEGFMIQQSGASFLNLSGFKYDIEATDLLKQGLMILLFIDHVEDLAENFITPRVAFFINNNTPIRYQKNAAREHLNQIFQKFK